LSEGQRIFAFVTAALVACFMKIIKLHIENFRGFRGTHDIEFSDSNIHAIVGVNGAGKTSILDAIGMGLEEIIKPLFQKYLNESQIFREQDLNIHTSFAIIEHELITENRKIETLRISKRIHDERVVLENNHVIAEYLREQLTSDHKELPVLIYYRSGRIFENSEDDIYYQSLLSRTKRLDTYTNSFDKITVFNQIFAWYLTQINIQNGEKVKHQDLNYKLPKLAALTKAISHFLTSMQGAALGSLNIEISQNSNEQALIISKADLKIEFDQLSSGEKMVLGMVLDIAYRMSIANPQLENPLISEGIVLIDELEQHLHPKWQMSILKALTATFPNVQFIVTTHSPLVINQLKNDQLSILDNFKIILGKEVHKVYGRDVNAIIEDFMGASHRPLDVKALMNDIEKLLDDEDPNTERARKKLDELKAIIDPNDYEVIKLETQIVMEEDETH